MGTQARHASSLLEVNEAQADDGEEHEGDHEGDEDGDDLAPEVPAVVQGDTQVLLQGVGVPGGRADDVLEVAQLEDDDAVERPRDGVDVVIPEPPPGHPLHGQKVPITQKIKPGSGVQHADKNME